MRASLLLVLVLVLAACGGDDVETNPFPGGPNAEQLCQLQKDREEAAQMSSSTTEPDQKEVLAQFQEIADNAPDEIKEDAQYAADMIKVQLDVINGVTAGEIPYEDMQTEWEKRGLDKARLEASITKVNKWVVTNCGVEEITTTTMGSLSTGTTPAGTPGESPQTPGATTATGSETTTASTPQTTTAG